MSERDDYLFTGSGPSDPEIAALVRLLSPLGHDGRDLSTERLVPPTTRRRSLRPWLVLAAALVIAVVTALAWPHTDELRPGSSPRLLSAEATPQKVPLGPFGHVLLQSGAEVEFVHWSDAELRLRLRRGTCVLEIDEATSTSVPFVRVETEFGEVAVEDQVRRCYAELTLDPAAASGELRVHDGLGMVRSKVRTVLCPAGASTRLSSAGPTLPLFADASDDLREMVAVASAYATKGIEVDAKLASGLLLACRTPRDTLVLWHLLQDQDPSARSEAERALVTLVGTPEPVGKVAATTWPPEVWLAYLRKGPWHYAK
ncbi:MAG: hypothetical protein ABL997_12765 [Planctomycetota bacterium]